MIIIVFGLPGSGKSYFAARLAVNMNAEYINSDRLRLEMFPVRTYSDEEKMRVYERMVEAMILANQRHSNLVLDGTFYKASIRNHFIDKAEKDSLRFIEVIAEESIVRARLSKPREFSEADFSVYKKIKAEWEPMMEDHLTIESTEDNISMMLNKATDYLRLGHDKG